MDFATEDGYREAVVYTNQPEAAYPALPFGTGEAASVTRPWKQGNLDLLLTQDAPEGWTGRLLVTCVLKDAGADSWLELRIR